MKNLKQFDEFLNEGFLVEKEDDGIAKKIIKFLRNEKPFIDYKANKYFFNFKDSVVNVIYLDNIIFVDDIKLNITNNLKERITTEIYNIVQQQNQSKKREALEKVRDERNSKSKRWKITQDKN